MFAYVTNAGAQIQKGVSLLGAPIYLGQYEIHYELTIDGDDISGSLLGMYDVEGRRVEEGQE